MHVLTNIRDGRPLTSPEKAEKASELKYINCGSFEYQCFTSKMMWCNCKGNRSFCSRSAFQRTKDLQDITYWKPHYPHKCWMILAGSNIAVNLYFSWDCVICSIGGKIKSCLCIFFSVHVNTQIIKQYYKIKPRENKGCKIFKCYNFNEFMVEITISDSFL